MIISHLHPRVQSLPELSLPEQLSLLSRTASVLVRSPRSTSTLQAIPPYPSFQTSLSFLLGKLKLLIIKLQKATGTVAHQVEQHACQITATKETIAQLKSQLLQNVPPRLATAVLAATQQSPGNPNHSHVFSSPAAFVNHSRAKAMAVGILCCLEA